MALDSSSDNGPYVADVTQLPGCVGHRPGRRHISTFAEVVDNVWHPPGSQHVHEAVIAALISRWNENIHHRPAESMDAVRRHRGLTCDGAARARERSTAMAHGRSKKTVDGP